MKPREKSRFASKNSWPWFYWIGLAYLVSILLARYGIIDEPLQLPGSRNQRPAERVDFTPSTRLPGSSMLSPSFVSSPSLDYRVSNSSLPNSATSEPKNLGHRDNRSEDPIQKSIVPANQDVDISPEKTSAFWESGVAAGYVIRFDDPDLNSTDSYARYMGRMIAELRETVALANSLSPKNVDPQLVVMVKQHAIASLRFVDLFSQMLNEMAKQGFRLPSKFGEEQFLSGLEFLAAIQNDPSILNTIEDKEKRKLITEVLAMLEQGNSIYQEIDVMQARMEERYPRQTFALPRLERVFAASPRLGRNFEDRKQARFHAQLALTVDVQKTVAYWQAMVVELYLPRFGTEAYWNSSLTPQWLLATKVKPTLESIGAVGVDHVDSNLVEMVKRHLAVDLELIELWDTRGMRLAQEMGLNVQTTSVEGEVQWMDELFDKLWSERQEHGENSEEQSIEFLSRLTELSDLREEHFAEIEVMQARLQERYKGQDFSFPELK